jgi:hypothetical protein
VPRHRVAPPSCRCGREYAVDSRIGISKLTRRDSPLNFAMPENTPARNPLYSCGIILEVGVEPSLALPGFRTEGCSACADMMLEELELELELVVGIGEDMIGLPFAGPEIRSSSSIKLFHHPFSETRYIISQLARKVGLFSISRFVSFPPCRRSDEGFLLPVVDDAYDIRGTDPLSQLSVESRVFRTLTRFNQKRHREENFEDTAGPSVSRKTDNIYKFPASSVNKKRKEKKKGS